jgi:CHRD domain
MKTQNIFTRYSFVFAIAIAGLITMASCKKDKNDTNNNASSYTVAGSGSGSQESPAVTTTATASLTGTYNATTNKLDYTITWTGLSGVASVVQLQGPGGSGVNASVITGLTITTNGVSGTSSGSATLTDDAETALLAGNVYYNILTVANPTGEVRGQVSAVADK